MLGKPAKVLKLGEDARECRGRTSNESVKSRVLVVARLFQDAAGIPFAVSLKSIGLFDRGQMDRVRLPVGIDQSKNRVRGSQRLGSHCRARNSNAGHQSARDA